MINFVCLKWGTKYSAEFVNKLNNMLKRHVKQEFKLYCVTEDDTDIDKEIEIISLDTSLGLEKWWNKMVLFSDDFPVKSGMFLDLDLIVQKDISRMYEPTNLMKFLYTDWIDLKQLKAWTIGDNYKYCDINSSVLCWDESTRKNHIWKHFLENKEKILFMYKGIDNYINNVHKYDVWKKDWAYSYWNCNEEYRDEVPIILFDYNTEKQDTIDEEWVRRLWQ